MNEQGYLRHPAIRGDNIVFVCDDDLWSVGAQGGTARRLTAGLGEPSTPCLSPDGKWLAYSREDSGAWHLWVMDLAGRHHTRITDGGCNSVEPAWGPGSRSIVYASDCGRGVGQTALCARDVIK